MRPSPLLASVTPSLEFDSQCYIACDDVFVARSMTELPTAYKALREGVGLPDRATEGWVHVTGTDAVGWLNSLCTQELRDLDSGEGTDAFFLNEQGIILFDTSLYLDETGVWVSVRRTRLPAFLEHLGSHSADQNVAFEDHTIHVGRVGLMGPQSEVLLAVFDLPDADAMPLGQHRVIEITQEPVRVCRSDFAGAPGYDLIINAEWFNMVLAAICSMGMKLELHIYPIGMNPIEITRVEAGRTGVDTELPESLNPLESGQEWRAVTRGKSSHLGAEAVEHAANVGAGRCLRGLEIETEGDALPAEGATVLSAPASEEVVGKTTSVVRSPERGALALAVLNQGPHGSPDTTVAVLDPQADRSWQARVVELPWVGR